MGYDAASYGNASFTEGLVKGGSGLIPGFYCIFMMAI